MPAHIWRDTREQQRMFVRISTVLPVSFRRNYIAAIVLQVRKGNAITSSKCIVPVSYVDAAGNWSNLKGSAVYQSPDSIRFTKAQAINALQYGFVWCDSNSARTIVGMGEHVLRNYLKG